MPFRDLQRVALTLTIGSAISLGPALDARQTGVQSLQYRSPEGVEYRSLPDTDAVKSARAALDADPKNISKIIDLGVAQSGARQFREAIATFTRGLEIEPDNALLLRWRGHRYLSVREFDRAFADLTRGGRMTPRLRHLVSPRYRPVPARRLCRRGGIVRQGSADAPDAGELAGSTDWFSMSSAEPGAARKRRRCSIGGRTRSR